MLVFSRRRGEAVVVGDGIEIVVLSSGKEGVRIGVRAPLSVAIATTPDVPPGADSSTTLLGCR